MGLFTEVNDLNPVFVCVTLLSLEGTADEFMSSVSSVAAEPVNEAHSAKVTKTTVCFWTCRVAGTYSAIKALIPPSLS